MKIRLFKPLQAIIILLWLPWQLPVAGRPLGCSLARNYVVEYPHVQGAEETCWPCPECPMGQGLTPQCGSKIPNGTKIECEPCKVNKTFSDSHGIGSCSPCNECGLRNVLQPCTLYQNRKCGKNCPKGFSLNDNDDCQAEVTSMPKGTKATAHNDDSENIHNLTGEQLKTTQVSNATGLQLKTTRVYNATVLSAKKSSDGEITAMPISPETREWETPTPPSENNTADDSKRNKDKEPQTVNQTTFIVVVTLLLAVIAAIVLVCCWVIIKKSSTESAESRGAAGENIPLASRELDSDGSTQGEDILDKEEAEPNIENIPAGCTISDIESLCDDENQPMLFFVKSKLDAIETLTRKTWRSVGQALKVSPTVLDLIETEYQTGRSPTEVLIGKLRTFSKEPTLREFVQALVTCERNDVASYICNWPWEKLEKSGSSDRKRETMVYYIPANLS